MFIGNPKQTLHGILCLRLFGLSHHTMTSHSSYVIFISSYLELIVFLLLLIPLIHVLCEQFIVEITPTLSLDTSFICCNVPTTVRRFFCVSLLWTKEKLTSLARKYLTVSLYNDYLMCFSQSFLHLAEL